MDRKKDRQIPHPGVTMSVLIAGLCDTPCGSHRANLQKYGCLPISHQENGRHCLFLSASLFRSSRSFPSAIVLKGAVVRATQYEHYTDLQNII